MKPTTRLCVLRKVKWENREVSRSCKKERITGFDFMCLEYINSVTRSIKPYVRTYVCVNNI